MKIRNRTYVLFFIFTMSVLVFMIMIDQTTALNQLSVFQTLEKEELEWGKNILEQCKLSPERYAEMKEALFNAEQELLNDNPSNAAKYFNLVRPALGTCQFELSGKPHPIETTLGQSVLIFSVITGGITTISFLRDTINRKSSTKK